jgi:hypothetical protein
MRRIILYLLHLVIGAWPSGAQMKSDLQKMKLHGAVQTIYENSFGIIEESNLLRKGPLAGILQMNFNRDGFLTEEILSDNAWDLLFRVVYYYQDSNRLTRKEVYGKNDILFSYKNYSYNHKNNTVTEEEFEADGRQQGKTVFKYDTNGNLVEQKVTGFLGSSNSYLLQFAYDEKGFLRGLKTNQRDVSLNRETYEYDPEGLLLKTNYFKGDEQHLYVEYKYEFDTLKNWVKLYEIPSVPWDLSYFKERNISYY